MRRVSADQIRTFILDRLRDELETKGLSPSGVPDDYDLFTAGMIDSMGIIELIAAMEVRFDARLDFEDLDAESLTIIGPLSRYIEKKIEEQNGTLISLADHEELSERT